MRKKQFGNEALKSPLTRAGELMPLGATVKPYGRVVMIGFLQGERYYFFEDDAHSIAMMPATVLSNR